MDKKSLQQRLATLLGVDTDDDENYVSDILESLIATGDSPDDVADYLTSFVGSENEEVRQLSIDIQKFKVGETASSMATVEAGMQNVKISDHVAASSNSGGKTRRPKIILDEAAAQREATKSNEKAKQKASKLTAVKKKEVEDEQRRLWEEAVAARKISSGMRHEQSVTYATTASDSDQNQTTPTHAMPVQTSKDVEDVSKAKIQTGPKKVAQLPVKPPKGTPKNKPCGCYGNMHKPLKNCLNCGRISCELEGINDYCHFCGYFIGENNNYYYHHHSGNDDAKLEAAILHKEKIIGLEKGTASGTQILDDQEDYYVAATSAWNTEREQGEYHAMEEERRQKVHDRQRNVISFT